MAAFIIDRNTQYESEISQAGLWITQLAKQNLEYHKLQLEQMTQLIQLKPKESIKNSYLKIEQLGSLLKQASKYSLKELNESVIHMEQMVRLADPKSILKRGYAIIKKDGDISTSLKDLKVGEDITVEYHDGKASAQITKIKKS